MGFSFIRKIRSREVGLSLVIEEASGLFCKLRQAIITREYCKYVCQHVLCSEKAKRHHVLDNIVLRGGPRLHPHEEVEDERGPLTNKYPFLHHPALVSKHEPR